MKIKIKILIVLAIFSVIYLNKIKIEKRNKNILEKILVKIDESSTLNNGIALAKRGTKYGIINNKGQILIDFKYKNGYLINKNFYLLEDQKSQYLYSVKIGRIIEFEEIDYIDSDRIKIKNDNKYGIINDKFELIVPIEYDELLVGEKNIIGKKENLYFIFDSKLSMKKIKNEFQKVIIGPEDNFFVLKNNLWGIIDKNEKKILECEYTSLTPLNEKDILLGIKNSEKFLINLKTNNVIKIDYENMSMVNDNKIMVLKNGKIGYIDFMGKEILPVEYEGGFAFDDNKKFIQLKKEGNWFLYKYENKEIIKLDYTDIGEYIDDYMIVEKDGLYGYINENGKEEIPIQYIMGENFNQGFAVVSKESGFGIINKKNRKILDFIYDDIKIYKDKFYVIKDNKHGLFDKKGKEILPTEFDMLGQLSEGYIFFVKGKEKGFLKIEG